MYCMLCQTADEYSSYATALMSVFVWSGTDNYDTEFAIVMFACRPSVTQCARCLGSCSHAII